jgi:hypothetical protein
MRRFGVLVSNTRLMKQYRAIWLTSRKEIQSVAAQWRVKTRMHAPSMPDSSFCLSQLLTEIANIFICAGIGKSPTNVFSIVQKNFSNSMQTIVDQELRLNKELGQNVTSSDFRVIEAGAGMNFDSSTMVCEDEAAPPKDPDTVFCTTDLGLMQSVRKDDGNFDDRILTKARVILMSELQSILEEE